MSIPLSILLLLGLFPGGAAVSPAPQQQSWEKTQKIAESLHEILLLSINKKEFGKVLETAKQLFSLDFPPEKEELLVTEAKILTNELIPHQQYDLAHQILDLGIGAVNSNKLKAEMYKEKAYVCVKEGREEEAMKLFERSIQLTRSQP